jgi:hypothetical protein
LYKARELVWWEIPLQKKDKLLVGTVYRSPNSDIANNAAVNELLSGVAVGSLWRLKLSRY